MTAPEETGRALWARRVAATPDRPFLVGGARTLTYAEADAQVRRLAGGLAALDASQGTRVLVGTGNHPETVLLQLAVHQLGAVMVPLLGSLTFDELAYQIDHCGAELLVADDPVAATLRPRLCELARVDRIVALDELRGHDPVPPAPLPGYDDRSPLAILYTSGSTGRPKGVVLPAGSFFSCGQAFVERFEVREDDGFFLPVTLAHALGAFVAQSMMLHVGGRLAVVDRFSPAAFWQQVRESRSTVSILFPAHLNLLLETAEGAPARGESPLRLVITHAWHGAFRERFGVELATVWGMSETGALCAGSRPGERGPEGYVGTPMSGVEVEVWDDRLAPLPRGEFGEIVLRHRHVMLGYLDDPEATRRTLVDGWVRSGDRGKLDAQDRLIFAGRLKNVIKRSGENVSAEEVEAALAEHPGVLECLVFGVDDPIRTQEVAALVVAGDPGLEPSELVRTAATRLARWKLPRYVAVTAEPLPRLGNGKVDRMRAVRMLGPATAWDAQAARTGG
jgi:crotonobetaine/carnitine-CoA ligase